MPALTTTKPFYSATINPPPNPFVILRALRALVVSSDYFPTSLKDAPKVNLS